MALGYSCGQNEFKLVRQTAAIVWPFLRDLFGCLLPRA